MITPNTLLLYNKSQLKTFYMEELNLLVELYQQNKQLEYEQYITNNYTIHNQLTFGDKTITPNIYLAIHQPVKTKYAKPDLCRNDLRRVFFIINKLTKTQFIVEFGYCPLSTFNL